MDTNCQRCRQLLSVAMDGEATIPEENFIQEHLATCEDCLEAQADYRSIRSQFRTLSRPLPPPQLRAAVMGRTIARPRPIRNTGRGLDLVVSNSQKLALGMFGLAIIVLTGLIVIGLLRTAPFQVQGEPFAEAGSQTIVVEFNRPLDREFILNNAEKLNLFSVKDAQGNLLEIDFNQIQVTGSRVELTVKRRLDENQKIEVVVKPEVKDNTGAKVDNPGPKTAKVTTPKPTDAPRPTTTPTPTNRVVTTSTAASTTSNSGGSGPATPTVPVPTAALPTALPVTATPATSPRTTGTPAITPTVTITATVTIPATVTATVTITPTVSVMATVAITPPISVTPTITPTATITATVAPTVVPTTTLASDSCTIAMRRGFGKLFNEQPTIAAKIGCPSAEEAQAGLVYQPFQRGFMVWHRQSGLIYVFYNNGSWTRFTDPGPGDLPTPRPVSPGTTPLPTITPTATPNSGCNLNPVRGFGNIWASNPTVRSAIGCPLTAETQTEVGAFQPFARGFMFFNPIATNGRRVYVVFNDTTYQDLLDSFQG